MKFVFFIVLLSVCSLLKGQQWSAEKVKQWYSQTKWLSGCNYIPSNAINQLEMWQAETFSPQLIDKELSLANDIGFNTLRVFLHSLVWKQDAKAFKQRIDAFLSIADKYAIKPMFVFFDDCWDANPVSGKQRTPKPGVHNSGWVQDPGGNASQVNRDNFEELEKYVKDILTTFKKDKRILAWDLYNEPGNGGKRNNSLPLLRNVFKWGREVNPDQPLTAGVWKYDIEFILLNAFQIDNSDIITYHSYDDTLRHSEIIKQLKYFDRPLICTEYMARTRNSRFSTTLPLLKKENVGAINWGFVEGKTNTIYAWDTPVKDGSEPIEWFHDIYRHDFTPYRKDEIDLIRKLNKK